MENEYLEKWKRELVFDVNYNSEENTLKKLEEAKARYDFIVNNRNFFTESEIKRFKKQYEGVINWYYTCIDGIISKNRTNLKIINIMNGEYQPENQRVSQVMSNYSVQTESMEFADKTETITPATGNTELEVISIKASGDFET